MASAREKKRFFRRFQFVHRQNSSENGIATASSIEIQQFFDFYAKFEFSAERSTHKISSENDCLFDRWQCGDLFVREISEFKQCSSIKPEENESKLQVVSFRWKGIVFFNKLIDRNQVNLTASNIGSKEIDIFCRRWFSRILWPHSNERWRIVSHSISVIFK